VKFILTEEQTLLMDGVARFCRDTAEQAEKAEETMAQRWARMAELGLQGLTLEEESGGFGGGAVETMVVCRELGRFLVTAPFLPAVVVAGSVLEALRWPRRDSLVDGARVVVPAFLEPGRRHDLKPDVTRANPDGAKTLVSGADFATDFLVSALTPQGTGLFLVPANDPRLSLRLHVGLDGHGAGELVFRGMDLPTDAAVLIGPEADAIIEAAVDRGAVAACAEAVGIMDSLLAMSVEYLGTRKQFGVPLATFQVLQHRIVDMFTAVEQAKSMVFAAALALDSGDDLERRRHASAAKVQVVRAGRKVSQEAIQLHGAMGMTEEYPAGRRMRRLMALDVQYGDPIHHLDRLSALPSTLED
jgi:alkylation response protein AidB-like acyl-CoA dehydrogenase